MSKKARATGTMWSVGRVCFSGACCLIMVLTLTGCGQTPTRAYEKMIKNGKSGKGEEVYNTLSNESKVKFEALFTFAAAFGMADDEGKGDSAKKRFVQQFDDASVRQEYGARKVTAETLDGDRAFLTVECEGGRTIEETMIKEEGVWKLVYDVANENGESTPSETQAESAVIMEQEGTSDHDTPEPESAASGVVVKESLSNLPEAAYSCVADAQEDAEKGVAQAQFAVACDYFMGLTTEENHAKSFEWFKKAAEQGHAGAQFFVARSYRDGDGADSNPTEAIRWYEAAAEQGNADAMKSLWRMFSEGLGTDKDEQEAARWLRKAAESGDADAQYSLALAYRDGEGVEQSMEEGLRWLRKAAEQGDPEHQVILGRVYKDGNHVLPDSKEAMEWFRRAALQGEPNAQYFIGQMYMLGQGVEKDVAEAYAWFSLALMGEHEQAFLARKAAEQELTGKRLTDAQERARELSAEVERTIKAKNALE